MIIKQCSWCKKDFSVIPFYEHIQHCSEECYHNKRRNGSTKLVELICVGCNQQFVVKYKLRTQKYCNRSCASKQSWNLGLTMETSDKLRKTIEKSNETKAKLQIDGKLNIVSRGIGSKHQSDKLLSGSCWCRSTYEMLYCESLDLNDDVISYKTEAIFIQYVLNKRKRRYFPDFVVTMKDGSQRLVEIKPTGLIHQPSNIAKQIAAKQWCDENNMTYELVTEPELIKLVGADRAKLFLDGRHFKVVHRVE